MSYRSCVGGVLFVAAGTLLMSGCGSTPSASPQTGSAKTSSADSGGKSEQDEIKAAFAQLSSEDRPLAEAQGYCAVTAEPLGTMGPPLKLIIHEQPVFLCCKGCEKKAQADPEATLAKVEELKAKVKSSRGT